MYKQWVNRGVALVKVKGVYTLYGEPSSELQSVTCRMGSQCYLPYDTGEHTSSQPQAGRLVLDIPAPEGWQAEFALVLDFGWSAGIHPSDC